MKTLIATAAALLALAACTSEIGPQGEQGPSGPQGVQGAAGVQGPVGPQGPQGPPGPQGPAGPQGVQETARAQGDRGPQGEQGPPGAQGREGPAGPQGIPGPIGPMEPIGERGPVGPTANTVIPEIMYQLPELNVLLPRVDAELPGTSWTSLALDDGSVFLYKEVSDGTIYAYLDRTEFGLLRSTNLAAPAHTSLLESLLVAVGSSRSEAKSMASNHVSKRRAAGYSCETPHAIEIFTFMDEEGDWSTTLYPRAAEFWDASPPC